MVNGKVSKDKQIRANEMFNGTSSMLDEIASKIVHKDEDDD